MTKGCAQWLFLPLFLPLFFHVHFLLALACSHRLAQRRGLPKLLRATAG
jgi:hypothetical protein